MRQHVILRRKNIYVAAQDRLHYVALHEDRGGGGRTGHLPDVADEPYVNHAKFFPTVAVTAQPPKGPGARP